MLIKVVGFDPSLRNWGIAKGTYNLLTQKVVIDRVSLIRPLLSKNKQVRQNSLDLASAQQLFNEAKNKLQGIDVAFVEVPVGSQSARAMASYGICVGVLGSLRGSGSQFIEVSPLEVKMVTAGKATATKKEMIAWAMGKHPDTNWPTYTQLGVALTSDSQAEHMADAVATIYAGIASDTFKQMLPFFMATSQEKVQES